MRKDVYSKSSGSIILYIIMFALVLSCNSTNEVEEDPIETFDTLEEEMISRIIRDVDPDFVYEYEQTKFVPPEGKTLLIMGQTLEDIDDYMQNFSDEPIPGGWAAYWGIPEFEGVTTTFQNPNGSSHNHQLLVDRFPNTVIQSGMWMVGTWGIAERTANGEFDDVIRQYSSWAKSINRPIYLRIGYEFDGPHNELEPDDYVNAYRRIVDIMRAEGVDNVAFVWHSYIFQPYRGYSLESYYPGDEYVDWVGVSLFGLLYQDAELLRFGDAVMEFAKLHKKPVMAAEASPVNGIEPINLDAWNQWFVNFFTVTYSKNIKAISFINSNWENYVFEGVTDWKDARLANNDFIARAWFLETSNDRYLKQSENLFGQLGYQPE